jgi:ABC-type transport system substrate-binding protein
MTAANQDGPWDMEIEDLLSLLTLDSNDYLSVVGAAWNHSRHTDTKINEYYASYAREMDAAKRRAIAKELQEYAVDKLYWNAVSGSPFYIAALPRVKGYTYNAEFEVHFAPVWLER